MAKLEKVIYAGTAEKTTIQQVRLRLFCSCGGTCLGNLVMPDFDGKPTGGWVNVLTW